VASGSRDPEPYEIEYRFRRADGVYRWHLARVAPIAGSEGAEEQWTGTAINIDDRRHAEQELRASEARYRDVVDYADDIVYTIALDGTVLAVNQAVEHILGYPPEEFVGYSIRSVIVPEQVERSFSMLDRKLKGEERGTYEVEVLRKDGRRVTLEINNRLVAAEGRPMVIHGIGRDISERRERSRQVELSAKIGVALTDRRPLSGQLDLCTRAIVTYLDAAFARIWTIDDDDPSMLVLRASSGLYTHLDGAHGRVPVGAWKIGRIAAERRPHLSNTVVDDPEIQDQEWARREGMVGFAGYPLHIGDRVLGVMALFARQPLGESTLTVLSSIAHAISMGIDRDRAEKAQEALLERERTARNWAQIAERRYRGLFEGVADAILVVDADRRYVDANAAATTLLGYEYDELMQLHVEDVVAREPDWTRAEFEEFTAAGQWQSQLQLWRKDGSTVPVEARATLVDLPDGTVFLSAIRDISERSRLEHLQRDFLAMVTHDLRSPLTAIKGQSQLLKRRSRDNAQVQNALESVLDQVGRMQTLIDDLADVVRLESGEFHLRMEPFDLVDLVHEEISVLQKQTDRHTFYVEAPGGSVAGCWDRQRLGQVLQNLLTNAVKYSPDGGAIVVQLKADEDRVRIAVSDRGVGIPPEHLPQLFQRFYRAEATGAGGLGLGLYITKMLVEAHGGTVTASSSPGEGSTFTVSLPRTPDSATAK
jgi:PAS domain S-box-containing protein